MRAGLTRSFGVACAALLVGACSGASAPTPIGSGETASPSTAVASSGATSGASPSESSVAGAFPVSISGLPVVTVAQMHALAGQGKLDGRFAAVGGYFMQYALPCAFVPHIAPISGFCSGEAFSDNRDDVATYNGSAAAAALVMVETTGADALQPATGNDPAAVALIVHAADARSWQCAPADRADCAGNLVIDRVAWINGSEVPLPSAPANLIAPQEQLVTAYQLDAAAINDVDPRFNGEAAGQVWYARTAYGPIDH